MYKKDLWWKIHNCIVIADLEYDDMLWNKLESMSVYLGSTKCFFAYKKYKTKAKWW